MKEPKKQNKTLNFKIVHASQQAVKHIILSNSHPLILFSNLQSGSFIKWLAAAEDLNRASLAVQNFGNY